MQTLVQEAGRPERAKIQIAKAFVEQASARATWTIKDVESGKESNFDQRLNKETGCYYGGTI